MAPTDDNESTRIADGLLPPEPLLDMEQYLAMLTALGKRPQFEIVAHLVEHKQLTEDEIVASVQASRERVAASLSALMNAELIEKRTRNEPRNERLLTYYRPTIFAETLFTQGIHELLHRENAMKSAYNSSE